MSLASEDGFFFLDFAVLVTMGMGGIITNNVTRNILRNFLATINLVQILCLDELHRHIYKTCITNRQYINERENSILLDQYTKFYMPRRAKNSFQTRAFIAVISGTLWELHLVHSPASISVTFSFIESDW